ncbi:MAG: protein translocase subunit SecF [Nanobdellota archaeon]
MPKKNKKEKAKKQGKKAGNRPERKPEKKYHPALRSYFRNYKVLLVIPFLILLLAIGSIAYKTATTGEFINKGLSLKGGTSITITEALSEDKVKEELKDFDTNVRQLSDGAEQIGIIIETGVEDVDEINELISTVESSFSLTEDEYSVETMGSALGESFFRQTFRALIIAFAFMAIVVFLYFRSFAPSIAVVLAAFSDIVVTAAIVNWMGIQLSTAGIASFLMLIGYSVDTDILLTTKILKRKGHIHERIVSAMKTGLTMSMTTITVVIIALLVSGSPVIQQIMTILLIGLLVDLIYTWIQNVGILRLYVDKNEKA